MQTKSFEPTRLHVQRTSLDGDNGGKTGQGGAMHKLIYANDRITASVRCSNNTTGIIIVLVYQTRRVTSIVVNIM